MAAEVGLNIPRELVRDYEYLKILDKKVPSISINVKSNEWIFTAPIAKQGY